MMNDPLSLIAETVRRGITLWPVGNGKLGFRAPDGALTEEMRTSLSAHRAALVEMIAGPQFRERGSFDRVPFLQSYATRFWNAIRSGEIGVSFTNGPHWIAQVDGTLSPTAFAASVDYVASRHAILNAKVREYDDLPNFCWEDAASLQLIELQAESEAEIASRLKTVLADIVWRPFEPDFDILFRPFTVRVSESCHVIGFVLNHLIGDAVSVDLIRGEMLHAYEAITHGHQLHIPKPALQYSDYIVTMNAWLQGPAVEYRLSYWRKHLVGISPCKLPVDRVMGAEELSETEQYDFFIDAELIQQVARELATTVYFVLLAAAARALSDLTHQPDVAFVSMHHGRDSASITSTVGSMQNQLLLRIPAVQSQSFASLVHSIRLIQSEALQYQLPLGCICSSIPEIPPQASFPEFNCLVSGAPAGCASPPPEWRRPDNDLLTRMKPLRVPNPDGNLSRAHEFPGLKFNFMANAATIMGRISYLASEYEAATIARLVDAMTRSAESPGATE